MDDRALCGLLSVVRKLHPNTPACLSYHPDADPGDGSGWCLEVGDWRAHGSLDTVDTVATAWRKREGLEVPND